MPTDSTSAITQLQSNSSVDNCSQRVHTLSKYRECYLTYLLMISSSRTCKIQEAVETKKQKSVPTNIDYSTLQRAHQYFMEGYIPEKHVMFCLKDNVIWIKANCYHSLKNYDAIHEVKVAIANEYPHHVTQATCSCVAGKAGMCSHVIDLLKQIIHYVMMKLKSVPEDLSCTQMQQSWNKPRPTHIEAEPVMNVTFCKAKQCQTDIKKNPAICTLYETRALALQDYTYKQQQNLKENLSQCKPTCASAQIFPSSVIQDLMTTPFGVVLKGNILSY